MTRQKTTPLITYSRRMLPAAMKVVFNIMVVSVFQSVILLENILKYYIFFYF